MERRRRLIPTDEIVARFKAGERVGVLCAAAGVGRVAIYKIVKAAGCAPRSGPRGPYQMHPAAVGPCAICGEERPLYQDHDHRTGSLRDYLCPRCNSGLGQFLDRADLLIDAARYLERHAANPRREKITAPSRNV